MKKPRKDKDGNYPVRLVLAVEGVETSDGRTIRPEALGHRSLPLSIMGLTKTTAEGGHAGAEITGRLDKAERVPGPEVRRLSAGDGSGFPEGTNVWLGYGVLFPGTDSTERFLQGGLRGNSVDLTAAEAELAPQDESSEGFEGEDGQGRKLPAPPKVVFTKATIAATTLCPVPAFEDAYVEADFGDGWEPVSAATEASDDALVASLVAAGQQLPSFRASELGDFCSPCEADSEPQGIVAAAPPLPDTVPPADWFTDPGLERATRLTVRDSGEVLGHIAQWNTCHTSYQDRCTPPPRSRTDYAVFLSSSIRAQHNGEPKRMAVGQLTLGGGHAHQRLGLQAALEHYDNVASVVADIAVGEDKFGIWVHGALRPGVTSDQLRALEGSKPSGDWRRYEGNRELMAVHCVNVAGFPVLAAYADEDGPQSLVAAGALADGVQVDAEETPTPSGAVILDYDLLAERLAERLGVPAIRPDYASGNNASKGNGPQGQCSQDGCGNDATKIVLAKRGGRPRKACDKHAPGLAQQQGPGAQVKQLSDLTGRRDAVLLSERRRAALETVEGGAPLAERQLGILAAGLAEVAFDDYFSVADTDWLSLLDGLDHLSAGDRALLSDESFNWVQDVGGLPPFIKRVAKHLQEKGMDQSRAIATAINVVKKYCAEQDLNFPGKQQVTAKTKAEGCKAVGQWEEKKARSHAD